MKKKSIAKKGFPLAWVFAAAGGGVLLLVVLAVVVFGFLLGPPSGFKTVSDSAGGFRVYLPGQPRKGAITADGRGVSDSERVTWASMTGGGREPMTDFTVNSAALPSGTTVGPDQLEKLLPLADPHYQGGKEHEVVSRTPITLGGKPALEIRTREHGEFFRNSPPPPPEEFNKRDHTVYLVACNGKRLIVVMIRTKGPLTDDKLLRTIRDSFSFV